MVYLERSFEGGLEFGVIWSSAKGEDRERSVAREG